MLPLATAAALGAKVKAKRRANRGRDFEQPASQAHQLAVDGDGTGYLTERFKPLLGNCLNGAVLVALRHDARLVTRLDATDGENLGYDFEQIPWCPVRDVPDCSPTAIIGLSRPVREQLKQSIDANLVIAKIVHNVGTLEVEIHQPLLDNSPEITL